jgi:hypothetical protein
MSEHEYAEHPAITKLRHAWVVAHGCGERGMLSRIHVRSCDEAHEAAEAEVRALISELEAVDAALRDCGFPEAPTRAERVRMASNAAECNADALAMLEPERDRLAARVAELEAELDGRQAAALVTALQSENATLRKQVAELETWRHDVQEAYWASREPHANPVAARALDALLDARKEDHD